MTTRKPKLNLLYAADTTRRLQLATVTPTRTSSQQHARQWRAARQLMAQITAAPPPGSRKH